MHVYEKKHNYVKQFVSLTLGQFHIGSGKYIIQYTVIFSQVAFFVLFFFEGVWIENRKTNKQRKRVTYFDNTNMKQQFHGVLFWYERLESSFEKSVLRTPKHMRSAVYFVCSSGIIAGIVISLTMAAFSNCADKVISQDFYLIQESYACSGWDKWIENAYAFFGINKIIVK
ncbi:hypothetical protein RFI_27922 [Reticulomyxa filosa]|uniref:Uncharacterized protein n=1 Tax=Reticulomyxa filosa TaxID=46433 RepID=X6M8V9_RETFI|nr:hypothetical protein RFI_27922 [Reticulomyxa filosa]|eukprot:ETO09455.1 hypothetical protein RFI_27922 [Reticulomyxa filosa]